MATTTRYFVLAGHDFAEVRDVKGKKAAALELATDIRREERISTLVVTGAGTIVFEAKARKPQIKTKPYTRVVPLPEGFEVPDNQRVAYTRNRKGCAILHDAEEGLYSVVRFTTGETLATFETTRQCGRYLADHVVKVDVEAEAPAAV